jgi:fused signal recognition particle receptor
MDPIPILIGIALVAVLMVGLIIFRSGRSDQATTVAPQTHFDLGPAVRRALGSGLGDDAWSAIEEALLAADVGLEATSDIVSAARRGVPRDADEARQMLRRALRAELKGEDRVLHLEGAPSVVVVVGVNGTGKTTSIAKLASRLLAEGLTVVLGAADTFRAAAGEQLQEWGVRVGAPVVTGQQGGDPASVAFDAIQSARGKGADVVIVDTAGRLHGNRNLMEELAKIHRVAGGDDVSEVLLVLDATLGQNALAQVAEFSAAVPISGLILTKLDGTAKGGVVIAVERALGVPVKMIGVGEHLDDLRSFDPDSFVDSLLEGT